MGQLEWVSSFFGTIDHCPCEDKYELTSVGFKCGGRTYIEGVAEGGS